MAELDGIILVNKPAGISSAGVVRKLRGLKGVRKVGHAGTLDPFATGLLVCCINRATRLSRFFLSGKKKYEGVLRLGIDTDTQDFTGTVVEESSCDHVRVDEIVKVMSRFNGRMYQIPPVFSALKCNGVPLYRLARMGVYTDRLPRPIFVYNMSICAINFPEVSFDVHCSSGTYVRTICADIGRALGCGAHLKSLRRVASSNFSIDEAHELEHFESTAASDGLSGFILPMVESLDFMPSYCADSFLVAKIRLGAKIFASDFISTNNSNAVFSLDDGYLKIIDGQGWLVAVLAVSKKPQLYSYCCVF